MKTDVVFTQLLARSLAQKYVGRTIKQVSLSGPFVEFETTGGPLVISLLQNQPLIGESTLPEAHRSLKLSQMIGGLAITSVESAETERIVLFHLADKLRILHRDLIVELIPNYATLLVIENGRVLYASKERGVTGRLFEVGASYQLPDKQKATYRYHPQRELIMNALSENARVLLDSHLKRTDLERVIVARDLLWPTKNSPYDALQLSTQMITEQVERYYSKVKSKGQGFASKSRITQTPEEILRQARLLKKCGQALLSAPTDSFLALFSFEDWETGETLTLDLSKYKSYLEAAKAFFEKARRLERKAAAASGRIPEDANVTSQSQPFKRIEILGVPAYIGLSARGNEFVTFSSSSKHWWFHAKLGTGSHVVVRSENLSEELKQAAASIAAFHSSQADSAKVEVVYTQIRNVERHPKGKKGLVVYRNHESVLARPMSEEELLRILQ